MKKLLFIFIICIALVGCNDSSSNNNPYDELKALLIELDNKRSDYTVSGTTCNSLNYIENVTNVRYENVVVIGTIAITGSKSSVSDIEFLSEVKIGGSDINNPFIIHKYSSRDVPIIYESCSLLDIGSFYAVLLTQEDATTLYDMAGRFMAGYAIPTTEEMLTILKFIKPYIIKISYSSSENYIRQNNKLKALLEELDYKYANYTVNDLSSSYYAKSYFEVSNNSDEDNVIVGTIIITDTLSVKGVKFSSNITVGSNNRYDPLTIPAFSSRNVPFSIYNSYGTIQKSGSVYAALLTPEDAIILYSMAEEFINGSYSPTTQEMLTILKFVEPYIIKIGYQIN
ncbi:MAG: hypothetical protein K2N67_03020 [Mucispirillum sp.]|nr:hypothetical protein [Mucispirillum sp.]